VLTQHFISYSNESDGLEPGTARATPSDTDLANEHKKDMVTRCVKWVAQMPALQYSLKVQQLIGQLTPRVHAVHM
jgi:hypothetical protein